MDPSSISIGLVTVKVNGSIVATTDDDGQFEFEIESGIYNVQFSKYGYETKSILLDTDNISSNLEIELAPEKNDSSNGWKSITNMIIIALVILVILFMIGLIYSLNRKNNRIIREEE